MLFKSQNRNPFPPRPPTRPPPRVPLCVGGDGGVLEEAESGSGLGEGGAPPAPRSGRAWGSRGPQRHGHHPFPGDHSLRSPRAPGTARLTLGAETGDLGDQTLTRAYRTLLQTHTPGTEQRTEVPSSLASGLFSH